MPDSFDCFCTLFVGNAVFLWELAITRQLKFYSYFAARQITSFHLLQINESYVRNLITVRF